MARPKEFLYLGYYEDTEGRYILKIGTTSNLERRRKQHTVNYKKSPQFTMPKDGEFHYLWKIPLSRYNTRRYEDNNIDKWKSEHFGEYVRNDRFAFDHPPKVAEITIRKTYTVQIQMA